MATDNHTNDPGREPSPWSRPSVLISGMFLLVILLGGITFVILKGGNSKPHRDVVARPGHTTTTTTTSGSGSSTACTLPAGNQAIPSTAPPSGTQWATVGSMQVPQAPSVYGPQRTSGVFNTCFAHNPSGALLAAINLWAEGSTTASPSEVFHRLSVGAPANLGNNSNLNSFGAFQFAAYKYDSYSSTKAVVTVVLEDTTKAVLGAIVTPMLWTDGDWKYDFPPAGQLSYAEIPSLVGYIQWSEF